MKKIKILGLAISLVVSSLTFGQSVNIKDIITGGIGSINSAGFTTVGTKTFFVAHDGILGEELWVTDLTEIGTYRVKDINIGSANGVFGNLIAFGNSVVFVADDGSSGQELWISDGTNAGTNRIKDINQGGYGAFGQYFSGNWWYADNYIIVKDNELFFTANDGVHGVELWKSDGTDAGTEMVKDICLFGTGSSSPSRFTVVGNDIYFIASDSSTYTYSNSELWKTDGTEAGTVMVKDILPISGSNPRKLTTIGNEVYFIATDDMHGREVWKSDGTASGTVMIKDVNTTGVAYNNNNDKYVAFQNEYYFTPDDGINGRELWKTDGTEAGTVLVKDIHPTGGSGVDGLNVFGNMIVFVADNGTDGFELWKSDGTEAGTEMIKDINTGSSNGVLTYALDIVVVGSEFYFKANDGVNGIELWKSDGTENGTVLVDDINPGAGHSHPGELTMNGTNIVFTANLPLLGTEIWSFNTLTLVTSLTIQGQGGVSTIITDNGTLQMEATVLPSNPSDGTYTWSVSNGTGSAIIDVNGVLTAQTNGTVTVIATANDASGISASTVITLSNQTNVGVNENSNSKISMYPNPTNDIVNFTSTNIETIIIYTLEGQKVIEENNTNSINVSHLTEGIYFVKIITENNNSVIQKLIKN